MSVPPEATFCLTRRSVAGLLSRCRVSDGAANCASDCSANSLPDSVEKVRKGRPPDGFLTGARRSMGWHAEAGKHWWMVVVWIPFKQFGDFFDYQRSVTYDGTALHKNTMHIGLPNATLGKERKVHRRSPYNYTIHPIPPKMKHKTKRRTTHLQQ